MLSGQVTVESLANSRSRCNKNQRIQKALHQITYSIFTIIENINEANQDYYII